MNFPNNLDPVFIDSILTGKSGRLNVNILRRYNSELLELTLKYNNQFSTQSLVERLYWIKNSITQYPKCVCSREITKFHSFCAGYVQKYCDFDCEESRIAIASSISKNTNYEAAKRTRTKTNLLKYGSISPASCAVVKSKTKQTMLERYGVEHPFMLETAKAKVRMDQLAKDRYSKTCQSKYGTTWSNQTPEARTAISKRQVGKKMSNAAIEKQKKTKAKKSLEKFLNNCQKSKVKAIEQLGIKNQQLKFECMDCHSVFNRPGFLSKPIACRSCKSALSKFEERLFQDLCKEDLKVMQRTRKVIRPKELDIYIPDKKIGIEIDGLYWHSEKNGVTRSKAQEKSALCQTAGVTLLKFFEDEMDSKYNIVLSIIKSKLGLCERVYARKCDIVQLKKAEAKQFFDSNHLDGYLNSKQAFGLKLNSEIVFAVLISSSRFEPNKIELIRAAAKTNTVVVGGFDRIIRLLKNQYPGASLVSFANRRYSEGRSYFKAGFNLVSKSAPAYFYVKGKKRFSRQKFMKHKLDKAIKIFDPTKSEQQNMIDNGYFRIWDFGHLKFQIDL